MKRRNATLREFWIQRGIQVSLEQRAEEGDEGEGGGESRIISGLAAVFDDEAELYPGFREVVRPGAFKKTLAEGDARALWNHNTDLVMGRVSAKTLQLEETKEGLGYRIDPPDTSYARDALAVIGRGDVRESSFAFNIIRDNFTEQNDEAFREILEVELFEVSPVAFPAYAATLVEAKAHAMLASLDQHLARGDGPKSLLTELRSRVMIHGQHELHGGGSPPVQPDHGGQGTGRSLDLARRRLQLEENDSPALVS